MATYLIGARARYVLLEADNEQQARETGEVKLRKLYSHIWRRDVPIEIGTVRPATEDEIQMWKTQVSSPPGQSRG